MKTYGIEYSHIYSNEEFGAEQKQSIALLRKSERAFRQQQFITRRIVLIDDYSPDSSSPFNINQFLGVLSDLNATPDAVVAESQLIPYCRQILAELRPGRLQRSLERYVRSRNKYPCSLFIASWYMLRLGTFGQPSFRSLIGSAEQLLSDRILTIVPAHFMEAEEAALRIIEDYGRKELVDKIRTEYFTRSSEPMVGSLDVSPEPARKIALVSGAAFDSPVRHYCSASPASLSARLLFK